MARYRTRLPQLDGGPFLTDGGLETTLVFIDGIDLPHFAAIDLLRRDGGRERLKQYSEQYLQIARNNGCGFVLESVTWRASRDWTRKLGYSEAEHLRLNQVAIEDLAALRDRWETSATPVVVSGNIGPRGDGYDPGDVMTTQEAEAYHACQIALFSDTEADMVTAMTLTNVPEAVGIVRAAARRSMPSVISFTLETDGRLPTGQPLGEAIEETDAATDGAAAYYMINCAHPTHFESVLAKGGDWINRIRGVRANASTRSHAELDNSTDLDAGDPEQLGRDYARLRTLLPAANVFGGCCGTDHRHLEQIGGRCSGHARAA
ncbi:homocysteine S-methyltransferase family protein [Thalassobaculum salexigens]|uniref:homocysteine S-methyltransferase family protein n=1 Tax=Thalassobaculum salexigens TaxID=455360 RepID=UPI00041D6C98|nr:homocysteine S-methyltransferase family protein [Thalassobaculum salexigens]